MQLPSALFNRKLEKFLIFWNMELSGSNIEKFLIRFYISGNKNPEKKFLMFQKTELFYISENENPEKTLYISVSNLPSSKSKKEPTFKNFLIFRVNEAF